MSNLKIEKGVPMPPSANIGRKAVYPFAGMAVGDSFLVPFADNPDVDRKKLHERVRSAASNWRRNHPDERMVTSVEDAGVRCWRLK